MAKLKIDVDVTGAKEVKNLDKSLKLLEASSRGVGTQNKKTSKSFAGMAAKGALAVGAIYAINKAMRALMYSGFTYNTSLEESKQGLVALSVAVQDKAIPVMDRYANANREATYTLTELQEINAETPHTLNQTNKIYKAMYVSMRGVGATTEQMINLTKKISIAAGAAGIEFNSLLAGVDGLATGTVLANSDLGRFLGGLKLSNKALKETDDVMALLTSSFEDFRAADTMAVAVSNMNNAWSIFAGNITKPIFEGVKNSLNLVSESMNKYAPMAMQTFSDALVDMVNAGVKSIGFLAKVINQLIGTIQIAYSGYQKLAGFIGGGDTSKMRAELAELRNEHTTLALQERRALEKKIAETERWNEVRRGGDDLHLKALKRTEALNDLISNGVEKMTIQYGTIPKKIEDQEKPLETVFKKIKKIGTEQGKNTKKAKKNVKDLEKIEDEASKRRSRKRREDINRLTSLYEESAKSFADSFAEGDVVGIFDSMSNGFLASIEDMKVGYEGFSKMLDGITMSSVWGALLWGGSKLLSSFMGGTEEEPPALTKIHKVSDSIANSLQDISNVQNPMLSLTRQMTEYLQAISLSFGGLENSLTRSGVDLSGSFVEPTSRSGFLFGGKKTELYGTSIDLEAATMGELVSGQIDAYLRTVTKIVSTSWYGRTKTKYDTDVKDISASIAQYISEVTSAAFDSMKTAAGALGISTRGLSGMVIDIGEFETTGMSSDEISAEIERRYGAELDAISEVIFAPIVKYQQGGEGLYQTAMRVSTNMDQVTYSLGLLGLSLKETTTIISGSHPFFGSWTSAYKTHIYDLTEAMIAGAKGVDALHSGIRSYTEGFFSEQEQYQMLADNMGTSFSALGLDIPNLTGSADEVNARFRELAEGININTVEGAKLFGELMTLAGGFDRMSEAGEALRLAEEDRRLAEAKALKDKLDAEEKLRLAEAKALKDKLDAEEKLRLAEAKRANEQIEAAEKLYKTNMKNYTDSISALFLGSYSNLSPTAKMEFARRHSVIAQESAGQISSVDALRSEMEVAFKYATTQEEYSTYVDRLASQLREEAPKSTTDDVVHRLDTLIRATNELNETTKMTA